MITVLAFCNGLITMIVILICLARHILGVNRKLAQQAYLENSAGNSQLDHKTKASISQVAHDDNLLPSNLVTAC